MTQRLQFPLDPAKVREANEALWRTHPELKQRLLTMSPKKPEPALRREWVDLYLKTSEPAADLELAPIPVPTVETPCRPTPPPHVERAIRKKREGAERLKERVREQEERIRNISERAKTVPGLGGAVVSDLTLGLESDKEFLDKLERDAAALEKAVEEGAPPERYQQLEREQRGWWEDGEARYTDRLNNAETRLAEAEKRKCEAATPDEKRFWDEAIDCYKTDVADIKEDREYYRRNVAWEREMEAKRAKP